MNISIIRDVKPPSRATDKSAGIDFYIPDGYIPIDILPGESVLIPSGVRARVPHGMMLMAANKSGVCTNTGLIVGAQVIDEDYTGEIHLHLINVGDTTTSVAPGEKVVQFIIVPVSYENINVIPNPQLFAGPTERGEGNFGSTDD
jgi:dUTP pyrophosphatase